MRTCSTCGTSFPDSEFYSRGPGKGLRSDCKSCFKKLMRPRSKKHYRNNKPYYMARNKVAIARTKKAYRESKNNPCVDCGSSYPYYVMQFDHVRGTKEDNVSNMLQYGLKKVKEETRKCDLVCANCHAERTHQRRLLSGSNRVP